MHKGKHSAILSTFIKLRFIIKIFVLSIFEWPFYTGFTVLLLHMRKSPLNVHAGESCGAGGVNVDLSHYLHHTTCIYVIIEKRMLVQVCKFARACVCLLCPTVLNCILVHLFVLYSKFPKVLPHLSIGSSNSKVS